MRQVPTLDSRVSRFVVASLGLLDGAQSEEADFWPRVLAELTTVEAALVAADLPGLLGATRRVRGLSGHRATPVQRPAQPMTKAVREQRNRIYHLLGVPAPADRPGTGARPQQDRKAG